MTLNDPLSNALSKILNYEKVGKKTCIIFPASKLIKKALTLLQDQQYVGEFKEVQDSKGNYLILNLLGRINKCGAVKPRFSAKIKDYEKYEKRYLPARAFGIILVSTSQGLMSHPEAKKKKLGGRLIAFCY